MNFSKKLVKEQIKPYLSQYRYIHTVMVAKIAEELAHINGVNPIKAFLAAMYHDVCKEFQDDKMRHWIDKEYFKETTNLKLLHGIASANFVRHKFACTDKQVLNAIADHVMPPQHAPKLTMILYLADKLESNKNGNYQNPNNYYLKKAEHNLKGVYQYIRDINAKDKTFWLTRKKHK